MQLVHVARRDKLLDFVEAIIFQPGVNEYTPQARRCAP
jgi:hypothetical protein